MKEILPVILWLISFAGYTWFWIAKQKLHPACGPLAAMSALTLWIYIGGMLRMLSLFSWIAFFAGIVLFGWMLWLRSRALLKFELLYFLLGCLALWLRYRSSLLVAYDDFSHWGMIVRHMLLQHRLPHASDALITFQSYPPGAACWVYYFCRFLGTTDGMMLTAQAALTLSGWLTLFSLFGKRARFAKTITSFLVILVGLSLFQGTASLMVDNLLSALAIGAFCLMAQGQLCPWLLGMLAAVLALVKDSGLYFALLILLAYACLTWRKGKIKQWAKQLGKLCLPVLLVRGAWAVHITWAFPAATVSRHALTLENLRSTGADKSYADMLTIAKKLLGQAFSLHNQAVQILLTMLLLAAVIGLIRKLTTGRWACGKEAAVVCAGALSYAMWIAFLGLMYIFSMPLANSLKLVAFERYNSTCALFLYGCMLIWLFTLEIPSVRLAPSALVLAALLPLLAPSWTSGLPRLLQENYFVPLRSQMETLARSRMPTPDESAAVIVSAEDDTAYAGYMARYVFQCPSIQVRSDPSDVSAQLYYAVCDTPLSLGDDAEIIRLP